MNFIKYIFILLLLGVFKLDAQKSSSVLATGEWYKIAIIEEGVYKIDAAMMDQMGIDRSSFDARNIAIYGNAYNGMLPQANASNRPDDLVENSIFTSGLNDGSFGSGDYLQFYGKSPHEEKYDAQLDEFYYNKNLYSDTAFYFLTIKDFPGLRIVEDDNEISASSYSKSYTRFVTHELDLYNLLYRSTALGSGREWYGELLSQSIKEVDIEFDNLDIISNSEIKLYTSVLSTASVPSSFTISAESFVLKTIDMDPVSSAEYQTKADIKNDTLFFNSNDLNSSGSINLKYEFDLSSEVFDAYVDYAHLVVENQLDMGTRQFYFYHNSDRLGYEIQGANNNATVWDVSDPTKPKIQNFSTDQGSLKFAPKTTAQKFIAFSENQPLTPLFEEKIEPQNLHALAASDALYITNKTFREETQRLADYRLASDGLLTAVVTVEEIFNEYSSGRQDVSAIRDFIRHQYFKNSTLKYVTLVGDCSYDYKNRSIVETNFVPVYQSKNSIHPIKSYSSEDFYGFMNENEGEWHEDEEDSSEVDLGVSRIPVQTVSELSGLINKIMRYERNSSSYGSWRNNVAFVADDGDRNIHQQDADNMAKIIADSQSVFNVDKIYLDAFEQISTPSGQIAPTASQAFIEALSNGNLIVNYTGHGNETLLAHEELLTIEQIENLKNRQFLPFFITATCQFGNYDSPIRMSGAEKMLMHPNGGSIGMLCSTRPVYASSNFIFNEAFYKAALSKENGKYLRIGDILRKTKNTSIQGSRNRNYALLGDASMKLAFPEEEIELTAINGQSIENLDSLNALGKYELEGQIMKDGIVDLSFDGTVSVAVYDKPTSFRTLGDESSPQDIEIQDVLIFKGQSTVTEGRFVADFIVPKNINYSFSEGKIGFYAVNKNKNLDAQGGYSHVIVGGSTNDYEQDNTPPEIKAYLNNTGFVSGQTVNTSSLLLAELNDASGINISKMGFGQDLKMYLDNNEPVLLNNYYTANLDTYQSGRITYPLEDVTPGQHTLTVEAFDVHNNRAEVEINFVVSESNGIQLASLSNYPNPMQESTTFTFEHDRYGDDLKVSIVIINMQGQEIIRNDYRFEDSPIKIDNIIWNGTDAWGNRPVKGIYIYKIVVQSEIDGATSINYRKLIIAN